MGEERVIPPPPPDRHREGEILKEIASPLGLVLWQDLRHLRDWAETPLGSRAGLFRPPTPEITARRREAGTLAADLAKALDTFAGMKQNPETVRPSVLSGACEKVAVWAVSHDLTHTAVEWAEIAARVDPENPRPNNLAGRITRNAFIYDRSERWFKIGLGKAREQDNKVELIRAHLGYGTLCKELGRVRAARRHFSAGANTAWRHGPPSLAAEAEHDLCAMLMVRGHLDEAAVRARRALARYPDNHHRIPFFAADVALMLVLGGRFAAAARLLHTVLRTVRKPPSARATIFALAARAYAGAAAPEESAVMRKRALRLLEADSSMEPVARWHLADALRLAGRWEAARAEAEHAIGLAMQREDRETVRMTRETLSQIESHEEGVPSAVTAELRVFLRHLAERLTAWSPRRGRDWPGPWGEGWAA